MLFKNNAQNIMALEENKQMNDNSEYIWVVQFLKMPQETPKTLSIRKIFEIHIWAMGKLFEFTEFI